LAADAEWRAAVVAKIKRQLVTLTDGDAAAQEWAQFLHAAHRGRQSCGSDGGAGAEYDIYM
jgi:hypothetical protein